MQENHELPQGWVQTEIGKIANVLGGKRLPAGHDYFPEKTAHPYLRVKDFENGSINQLDLKYISADTAALISRYTITSNDVYISIAGSIGFTGIIPPQLNGANLTENAAKISNLSGAEAKYVHYFFQSSLGKSQTTDSTVSTTQPKLALFRIQKINIPLPPLPEQRRIVAKLEELFSRWEAGVAALRQTQSQLKRYRQAVLHAAVTGELTHAWREAHPPPTESGAALLARIRQERRAQWEATQLVKRGGQLSLGDAWKKKYEEPADLDTSELPKLPSDWVWAGGELVADFVDPQPSHRTPPEFENGVAYIGMGDVGKGNRINFDQSRKVHPDVFKEHTDRYKLKIGDFFFGKIGTIGNPVKLPEPFNYTLSANIILVQPHLSIREGYLYWYMSGPFISSHFKKNSKATTQAAFGIQKARVLPVPLPPLAEQAEIVAEVERRLSVLDELEHTLRAELTRAERLRQSILHRAFTGRLVPQDTTDEPAAALLARLQAEATTGPAARAKRGRKGKENTQIDLTF